MEKEDFLKDDFLAEFMKKLPEESPSDNFVSNVMREIIPAPEQVVVQKPAMYWIKASLPYVVISLAVIIFLVTSDMYLGFAIPGKEYFTGLFGPLFSSFADSFRMIVGKISNMMLPLMIAAAAVLFFAIDKLMQGRMMSHQTSQ